MNRQSSLLPWLIWVLSALFVVFNYVQQVVPNIIAVELSHAFNATESTLGNIAASYFYAYAILQIPVGLIVDRFGTRRPLVIAILAAGLGTLAFSWAHSSGSAQIARLIMGASAAFSFIGCLKLSQEWFPPSRFSTLAGMTNTAGMIGAASGAPVAVLVKVIGWRESVAWMGGAELILAVLVFLIVRDRSAPVSQTAPATQSGGMSGLLGNPQMWINAVYATTSVLCLWPLAGFGARVISRKFMI